MSVIETFSVTKSGVEFVVSVVSYGSWDGFHDQWEMTDRHEGGVTIRNPDYLGRYASFGSRKFAIPQQTTLAELASSYAKEPHIINPSKQAYDSLQSQLQRDMEAGSYGFNVSATLNGVELFSDEDMGFGFDWSAEDDDSLEHIAKKMFEEYCIHDAFNSAQAAAKTIIARSDALKTLAQGA